MKNRVSLPLIIVLLIVLTNCKQNSVALSGYENGVYDYYFYECTGDNQFIKQGDKELKIQFNRDKSDKNCLLDLDNLKWTVLYPNSKGQIKLYGYFSPETGDFILFKWQLPAPFKTLVVKDEDELPLTADSIIKNALDQNDFEQPVDTPEKYNR